MEFSKMLGEIVMLVNFIAVVSPSSENTFYWMRTGPDPQGFVKDNPLCAGLQQSPIDIQDKYVISNPRLGDFFFGGYNQANPGTLKVTNTGKAASFTGFDDIPSLAGGGLLAKKYILANIHFHWGSTNSQGSEHTVNGHVFPIEMHLVHYSVNFGNLDNSINKPQGLAVLGVLFELTEDPNPIFEPLVRLLGNITNEGEFATMPTFPLRSYLPRDVTRYWRYRGSLTTPPCYESVIWTVFKEQLKLSQSQLDAFRNLKTSRGGVVGPITDNYRPPQPLNTRIIEECAPSTIPEGPPKDVSTSPAVNVKMAPQTDPVSPKTEAPQATQAALSPKRQLIRTVFPPWISNRLNKYRLIRRGGSRRRVFSPVRRRPLY